MKDFEKEIFAIIMMFVVSFVLIVIMSSCSKYKDARDAEDERLEACWDKIEADMVVEFIEKCEDQNLNIMECDKKYNLDEEFERRQKVCM